MGSIDPAFDPIGLALGAGATFVARTVDLWSKHLQATVAAAHAHKGTAFIEILQNCIIFNDGTFDAAVSKAEKAEHSVELTHGEPVVFGAARDKGVRMGAGMRLEVVQLGDGFTEADLIVHDAHAPTTGLAHLLATMVYPDFPVPTGIFRQVVQPSYEAGMEDQVARAQAPTGGKPSLESLLDRGDAWTVS
jgi:2-oxoglutarate ferredoxin oxidoreductase subunit beta